jgi:hypothetical protein
MDNLKWSVFKFADCFSARLFHLLMLPIEIFISDIVFFSSKDYCLVLYFLSLFYYCYTGGTMWNLQKSHYKISHYKVWPKVTLQKYIYNILQLNSPLTSFSFNPTCLVLFLRFLFVELLIFFMYSFSEFAQFSVFSCGSLDFFKMIMLNFCQEIFTSPFLWSLSLELCGFLISLILHVPRSFVLTQ